MTAALFGRLDDLDLPEPLPPGPSRPTLQPVVYSPGELVWPNDGSYFGGIPSALPDVDRPVAIDTETNGLFVDDGARVCVVSIAWIDETTWEIEKRAFPFVQDTENHPKRNLPREEWDYLRDWLTVSHRKLVMHNMWMDTPMMKAGTANWWPGVDLLPNLYWDTLIGQRALDPLYEAGLKPSGARYLGQHVADEAAGVKEALKKLGKGNTKRYDLVDWNVMGPYAAEDAELTIALAYIQWSRLDDGEYSWSQLLADMETARTTVKMEARGLPYDIARSREIDDDLKQRVVELDNDIPFKPGGSGSKKDKEDYFYGSKTEKTSRGFANLGRKIDAKTDKGGIKMDQEVVEGLAAQDVPGARSYELWKLATGVQSRYYRGYADMCGDDGRLRSRLNMATVRSGRLSATRVNLQAIPHDFRLRKILTEGMETPRALIGRGCPKGYKLWEMDLAQAELRVAAMFANCALMLEIIRDGRDPHGETASELFGVKPGDDMWGPYRQVGKRGNFSLIFGIGPPKFKNDIRKQTGLDLPLVQVRKIIRDWKNLYPEFPQAIDRHMETAEEQRFTRVRGPVMRWYKDEESKHKGFNQRVQGNLGQFGKTWMVKAEQYLSAQDLGPHPAAGLLMQTHDSLVMQVPDTPEGEAMVYHCASIAKDELWPRWFPNVPGDVDVKPWDKA